MGKHFTGYFIDRVSPEKNGNGMSKKLLFRWFGLGSIPKKLRPIFEAEQIVVADEGIGGRLICRNVSGPGKRCINRSEGFTGCLVITKKRIVCFTYGKRQINIAVNDPKISDLMVGIPATGILSISFESSVYRIGWEGRMEFRFKTQKARQFCDAMTSSGARRIPMAPAGT